MTAVLPTVAEASSAPRSALPAWMQKIEDSLKPFQKRVRDFILTRPASAVWMTMGSGKTLVTLSALSYLREPGHILVVAPRNIAVDTWPEELFDWNIPLRVTSLNITPPGIRGKNGRPNKRQRNLKPEEFKALVDNLGTDAAGIYTVGSDRFTELVRRIVYAGEPRVRPVGATRDDGVVDLDAVRDARDEIERRFAALRLSRIEGSPDDERCALETNCRAIEKAFAETRLIKIKPATASGAPPTVVIAHSDPATTKLLRSEQVRQDLAAAITDVTGQKFRVAAHVAKADYSLWPFPTVIIDEAQGFKNPQSLRWKAMTAVRPHIRRIIELSGTPTPEGAHEIWPQIFLLDKGLALGCSYTDHLATWFTPEQVVKNQVTRWEISRHNETQLHRAISHLAISAENTELDLIGFAPPVTHIVPMTSDLLGAYEAFGRDALLSVLLTGLTELRRRAYDKVMVATADMYAVAAADDEARMQAVMSGVGTDEIDTLAAAARCRAVEATGDRTRAKAAHDAVTLDDASAFYIEAINGGVLRNKLLQFASGAVYLDIDKGTDGYAAATELTTRPTLRLHSAKFDRVIMICDRHFAGGDGGSILIAYRFDFEKTILLHRLHRAGYPGARAYNGMPDTKKAWNRGEIPIMLVHPASAGHGLNLQFGGHTLIWTTLPDSNEHFGQTPARLNRLGQSKPVVVHTILTEGTIDMAMPGALSDKQASQQRLMQATRSEFKTAMAGAIAEANSSR
ncbi:SNF2-related protein [Rhodococcoides fascians]|uniref:SNF2-related protein n=1 Tax=Rhodococcoides fascians TaxID=1828 RepID=UPI000AD8F48A|nr:SNF2-related protein [Rhodococcus fascians]